MSAAGPILALDASTLRCAVALVGADGQPLGRWRQEAGTLGTADMAPAAADLLRRAGVAAAELAGVAVGTGPGSYTGLRSAIAFGRAVGLAAGVPLVGIPSVATAAAAWLELHPETSRVVTLLDARRGQSARAQYQRASDDGGDFAGTGLREVAAPELVPEAEAAPDDEPGLAVLREPEPCVVWLARLARPRLAAGGDDARLVLPLYLKPSHAELNLAQRQAQG